MRCKTQLCITKLNMTIDFTSAPQPHSRPASSDASGADSTESDDTTNIIPFQHSVDMLQQRRNQSPIE